MAHESFGVISPLVVSTQHPTSSWSKLKLNFNIRWKHVRCNAKCKRLLLIMWMGYFKKNVTPLQTHWSYVFLALTHRCNATVHPRNYAHGLTLGCCHNGRDGVADHKPRHCLLNRLFRRKLKKTSKLRVTDLCVGNSPMTGEFPAHMASNTEKFPFDDVIMRFAVFVMI